ncbi:MAG TPA: histidinol-phosphate transaminase [Deltaproteobacteria bacterium]|nr:histidinol-phosphate transaminase [Deltaproteobacteria bacterium]
MKPVDPAPWIHKIPKYTPGISKETIARDYGAPHPIKLASNENPLGPSPRAMEAAKAAIATVHLYPDPEAAILLESASRFFRCSPKQIIAGNGSDEILDFLCRAYLTPGDEVIVPEITFSYYRIAATACGAEVVTAVMDDLSIDVSTIARALTEKTKIVFIANPNNPTGRYLTRDSVNELISTIPPSTILVFDEAYAAFMRKDDFSSARELVNTHRNIISIHTLSKSHGLAGLRVGFGISGSEIRETLLRIKPPFNMNALAIAAGAAALSDDEFLRQTLETTWEGLDFFSEHFTRLGLACVPSQTNFLLVRIGERALSVYEALLRKGIITRSMASFGLPDYLRVSVGLPGENRALVTALEALL